MGLFQFVNDELDGIECIFIDLIINCCWIFFVLLYPSSDQFLHHFLLHSQHFVVFHIILFLIVRSHLLPFYVSFNVFLLQFIDNLLLFQAFLVLFNFLWFYYMINKLWLIWDILWESHRWWQGRLWSSTFRREFVRIKFSFHRFMLAWYVFETSSRNIINNSNLKIIDTYQNFLFGINFDDNFYSLARLFFKLLSSASYPIFFWSENPNKLVVVYFTISSNFLPLFIIVLLLMSILLFSPEQINFPEYDSCRIKKFCSWKLPISWTFCAT